MAQRTFAIAAAFLAVLAGSPLLAGEQPVSNVARRSPTPSGIASTNEWTLQTLPEGQPPAASWHSAVYDSLRDRLLLWIGSDVWECVSGWRVLPIQGPRPSGGIAVYDPARDRIIVLQMNNDVWGLNLSGTPQWTQLVVSGTAPPPRGRPSVIFDPVGDRLVIFGGSDHVGTLYRDVWTLSLGGAPQWGQLLPAPGPVARYGHSAIYDRVRQRMVIFAGASGFNPSNDTWALSLTGTPAWTQLFTANNPAARRYHVAAYDPVADEMVIFGGDPNSGQYKGDGWSLSFGSLAWSERGGIGGRTLSAAARDSRRNQLLIEGGNVLSPGQSAECWAWTLGSSQFAKLVPPTYPDPPARAQHAAVFDPVRQRMLIHGGIQGDDRVWWFDLSDIAIPRWRVLSASGVAPTAWDDQAVYDPLRDRMILLGGTADLAAPPVLTLTGTPSWTTLAVSGPSPAPRERPTAIYDPFRDRMLLYGGFDPDATFGVTSGEIWELTLGSAPQWTLLATAGTQPPTRAHHTAIYDLVQDRMVVLGGFTSGPQDPGPTVLDDLWALDLSVTPAQWQSLDAGPSPGPIRGHTAVLDPYRRRMLVYGPFLSGTVWSLSLDGAEAWSSFVPDAPIGVPPDLDRHVAVFDFHHNRMLMNGGWIAPGDARDYTWELTLAQPPVSAEPSAAPTRALLSARPNPSFGRMRALVTLPDASPARLEVFDLAGRRMAAVDVGRLGPGDHRVDLGETERMPPGVYLLRLSRVDGVRTARVVHLR